LFEKIEIVATHMGDATELALIGETKIEVIDELDRQVLEAKRRLLSWHHAQAAGHPQVDDNSCIVVEVDNEVLGAPADTADCASFDSGQDIFDSVIAENPGEIADADRADPLTDDLVEQGAADSFNLWEFWHTRMTVVRLRRRC